MLQENQESYFNDLKSENHPNSFYLFNKEVLWLGCFEIYIPLFKISNFYKHMIGGLMSIDRAMNYFIDLTLLKIDRYKGLTILKINFYDKILVSARAIFLRHYSKINTYTLLTKYFTFLRLKWMKRISFLVNYHKRVIAFWHRSIHDL